KLEELEVPPEPPTGHALHTHKLGFRVSGAQNTRLAVAFLAAADAAKLAPVVHPLAQWGKPIGGDCFVHA
ncbi:MAG: hypothetical protein NTY53_02410, partial [Kiritimatiellaeota bacterium]|nr:hypothetical protein [Kiritimatiellota bacterium]